MILTNSLTTTRQSLSSTSHDSTPTLFAAATDAAASQGAAPTSSQGEVAERSAPASAARSATALQSHGSGTRGTDSREEE